MRFVHIAREPLPQQSLQLELDGDDRVGVEQLTQVLTAEQLGEQVTIERQRLRPPLGKRLVSFIHELRDIREEKRRRKR